MADTLTRLSAFSIQLKYWRERRKLSQLALAALVESTPRHLSFLETGRSRPRRDFVLRLARALALSNRESNDLLTRAGFPPVFVEHDYGDAAVAPFIETIRVILEKHDPFPGCAMDPVGRIILANKSFVAFSPTSIEKSPEERVDEFFDPAGCGPDCMENWAEVAYRLLDRQRKELNASSDPRLVRLVERMERHLAEVPRPELGPDSPIVCSPRLHIDGQIISTFATVMRFEQAVEVNLSEIRIELMFPSDDQSRRYFEDLHANASVLPYMGVEAGPESIAG